MTTNPNQQLPADIWETILRIFRLAIRIPVCLILLFAVACSMIVASIIIYRVTAWMITILLQVESMFQNSGQSGPKKIASRVERWQSQSGQTVELRCHEILFIGGNVVRKEELREVYPPLKDGRIPSSIQEIRECVICLGAYHEDSVQKCPICGRDCCNLADCKKQITKEQIPMEVCADCATEINGPSLSDLWEDFWTLGEQ